MKDQNSSKSTFRNLEPGIEPDEQLVAEVAAAMRDFLSWHGAQGLEIVKSDPAVFGEKLLSALLPLS